MEVLGFSNDAEKMADFAVLSKDEFLKSYSYITEEEYDATVREMESEDESDDKR